MRKALRLGVATSVAVVAVTVGYFVLADDPCVAAADSVSNEGCLTLEESATSLLGALSSNDGEAAKGFVDSSCFDEVNEVLGKVDDVVIVDVVAASKFGLSRSYINPFDRNE